MKKPYLILLSIFVTYQFLSGGELPRNEVYLGFARAELLSGIDYDLLHDYLIPVPETYEFVSPQLGARHYFSDSIGVEVGSDTFGNVVVGGSGLSSLECYDISDLFSGISWRFPIPVSRSSSLVITLGAGGTYNWFEYAKAYKALIETPGYQLYPVVGNPGYYVKAGISTQIAGPFFVEAESGFSQLNQKIVETGALLGGGYWKTSVHMGLAF